MAYRTNNILRPPLFLDPQENSKARLLHNTSWLLILLGAAGLPLLVIPALSMPFVLGICGYMLALGLGIQVLLRFGHVNPAGGLLVFLGWFGTGLLLYRSGGLASPFVLLYLLVILSAGLAMSVRAAAFMTGLSILAALGLTMADRNGIINPVTFSPLLVWVVSTLSFSSGFILLLQYVRTQQQTVATALDNQRKLTQHNYELQEQQDTLARRISERTAEVSQYLLYMQTATEIGQLVAAQPDRERIMQDFVELLQMRFGLHYVGLFLIDRSGQWAVLQTGTGQTGRSLLARHHKIEIGSGMIGWCVANSRPRIAADIHVDVFHHPSVEFSNYRSEAAIPMRASGQVVGALMVQSSRPNSFDSELVTVLQNYADMLAATLENLRLKAENQAIRTHEQSRQQAEDRASWRDNLGRSGAKNLIYDRMSVSPMPGETNPQISQVQRSGKALISEQNGAPTAYIPVYARGQTIGVLTFRKPLGEADWSNTEVNLLEQLANQLGETLDNARLYQSIQRQAAREQLISEVGTRMRETLDVDTVLRTAADQIFRALQLEKVAIELVQDTAQTAG